MSEGYKVRVTQKVNWPRMGVESFPHGQPMHEHSDYISSFSPEVTEQWEAHVRALTDGKP